MSSVLLARTFPEVAFGARYFAGCLFSLFFIGSVFIHEFAHALIALSNNQKVLAVTLHIFGGSTSIEATNHRPSAEALIALAGPATSILLSMSFFLFASPLGTQSSSLGLIAIWLAVLNLLLGVINMLPGLPLDGGRVFHAIMWRATGNYFKGTLAATAAGQIIGIFSIIFGIALFVLQQPSLFGLAGWFFLVGWFLRRAAGQSRSAAIRNEALKDFSARDALQQNWPQVQSSGSVRNLAQDDEFINGKQSYLVYDGDDWVGIIPVRIVKALSAGEQSTLRVVELMVHHTEVFTAAPQDSLNLILNKMETDRLGYIPVTENTKVVGVVARDAVLAMAKEHSPMR